MLYREGTITVGLDINCIAFDNQVAVIDDSNRCNIFLLFLWLNRACSGRAAVDNGQCAGRNGKRSVGIKVTSVEIQCIGATDFHTVYSQIGA